MTDCQSLVTSETTLFTKCHPSPLMPPPPPPTQTLSPITKLSAGRSGCGFFFLVSSKVSREESSRLFSLFYVAVFFFFFFFLLILSFETINKLKLSFECGIPVPQDARTPSLSEPSFPH
jgi:hypothetical protein